MDTFYTEKIQVTSAKEFSPENLDNLSDADSQEALLSK